MSDKNRLSLVPTTLPRVETITPSDILATAKADCLEWRELAFENENEGAKIFLAFAESITALANASTKKETRDAIYSLVAWCEKYRSEQNTRVQDVVAVTAPSSPHTEEEVIHEIASRKKWLGDAYALMQPLQDEKNEIEDLKLEDANKRYEALKRGITMIALFTGPVEQHIAVLEHYLASLRVVKRGISKDILTATLAPLPAADELLPVEEIAPEAKDAPAPIEYTLPLGLSPELSQIVERVKFHPAEVLVYSLYDLLGPNNENIGGKNRGYIRICKIIENLGVFKRNGWPSMREALKGSQWMDTRKYLLFRGCAGGDGGLRIYSRTAKPLPWDARSLFTENEIAEYLKEIATQSVAPITPRRKFKPKKRSSKKVVSKKKAAASAAS